MKKLLMAAVALAAVGVTTTSAIVSAAPLVFDRGLPTANLNSAAGANRSNVDWGNANGNTFYGDTFALSGTGPYRIDTITTWIDSNSDLPSKVLSVTLFGSADDGSPLSVISTSATFTRVTYANGQGYQAQSGNFFQLWEVSFSGLNWDVNAGQTYKFGVHGQIDQDIWFNHASNGPLSGSPQDGADGVFRVFRANNPSYNNTWDSGAPGGGWDKSSDINVRVYADAIPEPAFFQMGALIGMSGLGLLRLRKRS